MDKVRKENLVVSIGILGLIFFSFWKLIQGMHSDEVYLIALGDMIANGNSFFKECWSSLQMSSCFSAPLSLLYETITGGMEGCLLFFRILSNIISLIITVYFYFVFSKRYNNWYVLLASLIFFTFIPDSRSFTYKQEMIWFTALEICFWYQYWCSNKKKYLVLLGIALSGNVLAFPTTILQFPMYVILLCWTKKGRKREIIRGIGILLLCCICCAAIYMWWVLRKISINEFSIYFWRVFQDKSLNNSYLQKMLHPMWKFLAIGLLTYIPLFLCGKVNSIKLILKKYHISVTALLLIASFLIQIYVEKRSISWHCITYPYAITIFLVPLLWYKRKKESTKDDIIMLSFEIPAIVAVLCFALASNQGNITSMYGCVISAMALVIMLGEEKERENIGEAKHIGITLVVMALCMYIPLVYEQETVEVETIGARTISTSRKCVTEGPAKGICLGDESYRSCMDICSVVNKYVEESDSLFIVDSDRAAPYGYLESDGQYATFSPQGGVGIVESAQPVDYFRENPSKYPTVIIVNVEYLCKDLEDWLNESEIGDYILEHRYNLIARELQYAIYRY